MLKNRDKIQQITGKALDIPELKGYEAPFIFEMFMVLHAQRGAYDEPIQLVNMKALFDIYEIPLYERIFYTGIFVALDNVYMEHVKQLKEREIRKAKRQK